MRCIIAGTRTIEEYVVVMEAMRFCGFDSLISQVVVGCAKEDFDKGILNADVLGSVWARLNRIPVDYNPVTPAEWKQYGKPAGPMRNERMAQKADALVLCWDFKSSGSRSMFEKAQQYGLRYYVHPYECEGFPLWSAGSLKTSL